MSAGTISGREYLHLNQAMPIEKGYTGDKRKLLVPVSHKESWLRQGSSRKQACPLRLYGGNWDIGLEYANQIQPSELTILTAISGCNSLEIFSTYLTIIYGRDHVQSMRRTT
ncbi:hypothetical protein [Fodinibius roseus]|uniref:hypothetical protein n=1 Tax=Fodinibius roseus TaxID=1194090 RepID=UPI0009342730|nr:hypothetical protein [Fodinibius roseus]